MTSRKKKEKVAKKRLVYDIASFSGVRIPSPTPSTYFRTIYNLQREYFGLILYLNLDKVLFDEWV
jgi:hypothetical protein